MRLSSNELCRTNGTSGQVDSVFEIHYNVNQSFRSFAFDTPGAYDNPPDLDYNTDIVIGGEWVDAGHYGFIGGASGLIEGTQNTSYGPITEFCGSLIEIVKISNLEVFYDYYLKIRLAWYL